MPHTKNADLVNKSFYGLSNKIDKVAEEHEKNPDSHKNILEKLALLEESIDQIVKKDHMTWVVY